MGQEQPDFQTDSHQLPVPLRVELLCQDDTSAFDPFWDGPRLLPAFAAQLLGQALPDRRDPGATVETAYGSLACPRKALLLDRKS